MWNKTKILKFILIIVLLLISCQKKQPDWPRDIMTSMWVPGEAQKVSYYTLKGTYQVKYKIDECYPAMKVIETIVSEMKTQGWKRLEFDSLNPKIKLNHARASGGMWSDFSDQDGNNISQWIEDWEDAQKNVVRYGLRYQTKSKVNENTCSLEVVVIFLPFKILENKGSVNP